MIIYRSIFVSLYIDIVVLGVLHIYKYPITKFWKVLQNRFVNGTYVRQMCQHYTSLDKPSDLRDNLN